MLWFHEIRFLSISSIHSLLNKRLLKDILYLLIFGYQGINSHFLPSGCCVDLIRFLLLPSLLHSLNWNAADY